MTLPKGSIGTLIGCILCIVCFYISKNIPLNIRITPPGRIGTIVSSLVGFIGIIIMIIGGITFIREFSNRVPEGFIRVTVKNVNGNAVTSTAFDKYKEEVDGTSKSGYTAGLKNTFLVPEWGYVKVFCWAGKILHPKAHKGYLYWEDLLKLRGDSQNKTVELTVSCWAGYAAQCTSACGKPGYWRRDPPPIIGDPENPENPISDMDFATYNSKDQKYYFFKNEEVWTKKRGETERASGPTPMSDWDNVITNSNHAVYKKGKDKKYYFFKGDKFYTKPYGENVTGPVDIDPEWGTLYATIGEADASVHDSKGEIYYFFKGDKYWSKPVGKKLSESKLIKDNWGGVPSNVDAAVYNSADEKYYFFKGDDYWEKPRGSDKSAIGPRKIAGNFI